MTDGDYNVDAASVHVMNSTGRTTQSTTPIACALCSHFIKMALRVRIIQKVAGYAHIAD